MRFWMVLAGLILLTLANGFAQKQGIGSVQGIVTDSLTRKPLAEATVSLVSASDSALKSFTITGGEGNFIFRNVPEGAYKIVVTFIGYQNAAKVVRITSATPQVNSGTIALLPITINLKEVEIIQEKAPVAVKGDTLEFNAGSFKTQPNAQVEELLKKLPGVQVERDGTIKAQGEEIKRVLVDGKPFFGDDPKMATRNLPADMIDKVQLYDQATEQSAFSGFDDGNREKTINLTTKKDKRKGIFGQAAAGVGTDHRYRANLNLNRFRNEKQLSVLGMTNNINQQGFTVQDMFNFDNSASDGGGSSGGNSNTGSPAMLNANHGYRSRGGNTPTGQTHSITEALAGGINFRDNLGEKLEVSGSYFLNNSQVTRAQQSYRQYVLPDTSYLANQNSQSVNRSTNHRLHLRLEYRLDSLTTLRIVPNFSLQQSHYQSLANSQTFTVGGNPLNSSQTDYGSDGNGISGNNHLLLLRKFRKRGRTFSVNIHTILNRQETEGLNQSVNTFYTGEEKIESMSFNQKNTQLTRSFTNRLQVSYTEPLSLTRQLELHYSYNRTRNNSNRTVNDFDEATGQYERFNPRLSNQFDNSFDTQRGGLSIQTKKLKFRYTLGLELQQAGLRSQNRSADSTISRQYLNVLPNALFTYSMSRQRQFRVQYMTRINPPDVSQLQPVVNNTNPLHIRLGNPELKPEYTHSLMANYNTFNPASFKSLFSSFNLNLTNHRIVTSTEISNTGVQTTRPINQNGFLSANGFLSLGRPVKKIKSNLHFNTTLNYNQGVNLVNGQPNQTRRFTAGQGISVHTNFSEKLVVGASGNLNYQQAWYSLLSSQNASFFNQAFTADIYYQLPLRLVFTSEITYNHNSGQSAGYNQSFLLWNASLGRQLFKNRQGELKLQVYDLLNQNRSLARNVTDTYIEDVQSQVLKRYFMLSFVYNLRRFGGQFLPDNSRRNPNRPNFRQEQLQPKRYQP